MDDNRWDKTERKLLAMLRATKTIFVFVVYCLAIALLTACAVTIVVKLIFWPPCTDTGKNCVIDPWSAAGLAGTILGVAATMLAILGALAVAAWWGYLDKRVTEQVNRRLSAQEKAINVRILKARVTENELKHLRNFDTPELEPFSTEDRSNFIDELRHLLVLDLIERQRDHGIRSLQDAFNKSRQVNVKEHFKISEAGNDYLEQIK